MKHVGTFLPHKHAHEAINYRCVTQALNGTEHCTMGSTEQRLLTQPQHCLGHCTVLSDVTQTARPQSQCFNPTKHMRANHAWCGTVCSTVNQ